MKKIHMFAALLAMLLPSVLWGTSYTSTITAEANPSAGGQVFVNTSKSDSGATYAATSSKSSTASDSWWGIVPASFSFYLYAKTPNPSDFTFEGWSETPGGAIISTASPYTVSFQNENRTKTYYANFLERTKYAVTLAAPTVIAGFASYAVKEGGTSVSGLSSGGALTAYGDQTYTFTCTISDATAYEFVGWNIDGTIVGTSPTLSKQFTSAATVTAVLREKAHYAVTLAAPELSAGFASYTVSGPGVSGSGLASGGSLTAYYDGTYSFTCTLTDPSVYEFVKWTITDSSGTSESTANPLSKQFSADATVTAVLNKKAEYQLTLAKPAGVVSYAVTGPSGAEGLSSGGNLTFFGATDFIFSCTIDDDYKFVKWTVADSDGTTDYTERTLSKRLPSSATVSAVVVPKEYYELSLPQLEGVVSYEVTGPSGALSISSTGKATVRELDSYTVSCTIDEVGYVFEKWTIIDSSGTTDCMDRTFTRTFSSATTVKPVLYKKGIYELTFVKPDHVTGYSITGPNGTVGISAEGKATVYELDSYTITCAYDSGDYEFVKWAVTDSDGTTEPTASPLVMTFTSDTTITVALNKLEMVVATCLPVPSGCSYKVGNETVTTAQKMVNGAKGQPLTTTLSAATAGSGYMFAGWYIDNGNGTKTYISKASSETQTFESDVTLGADFVSTASSKPALVIKANGGSAEYDNVDEAFAALEAGDSMTISQSSTLDSSAGVPIGATLTIPSGVTLTIASGVMLYVDGTVSNNGTISGTVSKCTKLIKQTGDGSVDENGKSNPFNPYSGDEKYRVKYWKTTITTPSITISGVSTTSSHTSIVNGYSETVYRGASANAFVCTTDKSVAINHIKSVRNSYSSGTDAYTAVGKNSHNVSQTTCNLMGGAASELVLLTAVGTVSVGSGTELSSGFIADCAGNNISFTSKQFANAANVITINGATVKPSKLTNARLTAINCTTVTGAGTDGINSNQASYYTSVHFYDCGTFSKFNLSKSVTMTAGTPGVCFFSGGPYSPSPAFSSYSNNYHVYGGSFSSDPKNYLASNDLEAPKEGSYWVVRVKKPTIYVAKVGTTEYESLQDAVNAASTSSGTVELLPGIQPKELSTPVTVASGKTVTIDLAGYAVTAPNGAIVNNGTLYLQDTSTFDVPGSLTTSSGNVIVNNGTLDVTYGLYTGNILLNGGTFTTHFGTFVGTVSVASGLSPKTVANLRGGEFSRSMSAFLRDGYSEVYSHVAQSDPMRYWVGQFPTPLVTSTSYSSAEKAWKLDFLSSSDLTLYKKTTARSSHSSLADWQRRAELYSSIQPWSGYVIDCGLVFDRAVASGSVTFYGKAQIGMSQSVDKNLSANEDFPALAHRIYEMGYTPLSFGRSIDEIGSVTAGVKNNISDNSGTVCTVDLRVCTQSKNTEGIYDKLKALVDVRYMLGGKKAAIDRGASRLAYDSLAAAVSAAQDGETVLIGADTSDNITVSTPRTFTIDPYGFNWTGNVNIDPAYFATIEESVSLATTGQDVPSANAKTYTISLKVAQVGDTFYANLTDAVAAANGAVVTLLAATDETITLTAEGQAFTLNKNGIAFDDAKVVTTIENGSVTVASGESGTVYTAVTSIVDASDGHKYNSVTAAIAGVPGNDISVTITGNDTEEVSLPQGKTLTVTTAPGVTADLTVTPGDGAFIVESAVEGGTKYESKKITVEMAEPQTTVVVTKIDNGTESEVKDSAEITAAIDKLESNHDVPRTDNTDKLDVLDVITVTPTKIVEEVVGGNTIIRSATFDVTPALNAGQSLGEGQTLKFRLPVDAAATQLAAIVYHNGAQFGIYPVQSYNEEKFIEVESDAFSPYGYTILDGETANPVAVIGTTGYASLAAAATAAQSGDTIVVIADISDEAVEVPVSVTITSDDAANPRTLSNVSINATGSDISLTVKDLAFIGNSWINSANGGELTVENVTADVSPSNGTAVNSRSAFIGLGRDESKTLALTVKDSTIVVPSGTDAILGWAKITEASIEGTTIGSASKKINSGDAVKIMGVASGATITFVGNTVYSDWNGIAIEPNTSRDNDYTAIFEKNTFVGDADHIWFDAQGSTVSHATVLATSDNTVNGAALTPANIANNDSTWTSYAGVDVVTNAAGKVTAGTFTSYSSDSAIEAVLAEGYVSETDANGWYHVDVKSVAQIGTTKYSSFAEAIAAAEEYKTANGDYPVITVLDATAEQTNPDWKIADGKLVHKLYVAQIGSTKYESLAEAVAAASAGDTITMLADDNVSLTDGSRLTIDKALTITGPVDTNGEPLYTIYGTPAQTGTNNIYVDGDGTVTLSNLKIEGFGNNKGTDSGHAPVYVASSFAGTVNLDNLYISDFNRGGVFLYGGTFNVTDCYIDCANNRSGAFTKGIEIKGTATGTIADTLICNMERSGNDAPAGIEIYGKGSILVDGCTIISDVDDHSSVKATYGIVSSRVGEHDPSGGSLHVTDCYIDVSNAALSVADSDEYGPVNNYSIVVDGEDTYFSNYVATWSATSSITINEGEFNEDVYAEAGTITITDGTFSTFAPYAGTDGTISISGGVFDRAVAEEYCAEGYIPAVYNAATGLYTVKTGQYVAAVYDDSFELVGKYETLYDAVRAAQDGYTVELLADVEESVTINKSIALTTGDYTITGVTKVDAGATVTMEDVTLDGNGMIYALDIAGGATVEVADVTIGGGQWCNVHLNGGALTGSGVTMLGDDVVVAADGQSCTYRGETVTEAPWGMDLSKMAGKTLKFPFMDIVRESGTDVVELDDSQDKPLVQAGSILYVANMPGDTTLTGVTLPARFGSYSLTIDAGIAFLGDADTPTTGWTIGDWNEVIDTGSTVLDAIGEDSDDVPVELTLNGDVDLGDNVFEFRYQNLTIDGANHAVSGTIKYTDDAGVVENIVLGTEEKPLTLDMTEVSDTIHLGNGVDVANVVVQLTDEQATAGTPVFTWTAGEGATAPVHEEVVIQVAGSTSDSALVWDNELGVAYIGPCEARLTGPTHEEPVYTSLAHAIELAANSGDTVTLLMDIENFTDTQIIGKSLTLDGAGHKIVADADASGEEMFDVAGDVDVTIKNVTVDGVHKYTYCIQAFGEADLTLQDVTVLHGTKEWFSGFKYGAGVHVNGATLQLKGNFTAFSGGKTDASFPFTGILYEGGAVIFADGATASIANPENATDTDLLLVGMLGALDVSDPDDRTQVEEMLDAMNVPAGFYPYTLKINPDEWNDSFEQNTSFTGASPLGWNDIIDYGKAIMGAISMDTAETPVEVGLLTDTILPDTFTFEDANFTVNGNDYALSGTIAYTDNAGLLENLVMGTDDNALVLDMTGVTEPIEIGSGIVVDNVTVKLTEDQATAGTPVIIWDAAHGVDAPENEAGVAVQLVDDQGEPTGDTAELIWDDEMGMAYIGPVEARLTGPTHDKPIYTTLADAIEQAEQTGDTVTLMMDITGFSGTQDIAKSLTLDGAGHKIVAAADASGEEMFDVAGDVDVTITGLTLDGVHKYTYCVQAYGSDANLTLNNVTILHGTKEWFGGFKYGAGVHVNNAHLTVSGGFTAFSGGKTDASFPFTGILYEGGTIQFADGATASIANPEDATDTDLLLVGMLGALDVSDPADKAEVEAMLAGMNIPAGYYPYTLKINPDEWNSGFEQNTSFTGASPLGWNSIIDYGKAIMTAVSMDTAETPVELPDTFTYQDANFSVNGNGNALSGTIVFKNDAEGGLLRDIELGANGKTLVLDLSQTTNAVDLGAGVVITDITVKMTEDQARVGTVVFDWNTEEVTGDDLPQHGTVSVTVVNDQGGATGDTKGLIWDEEYGIAYIGPVEARLTGATHETPIYTTLADALARALDGDTVKLLSNATLAQPQDLAADATLDLAGLTVDVTGAAGILVTNATLSITNTVANATDAVTGTIKAGTGASPTALITSGEGGTVRIPMGIFAAAEGGKVLETADDGAFAVSGGYFSVAVLPEYCAPGYAPADAETGAPQPYTVAEAVSIFVYPIEGTAGVAVSNEWLAAQFPSIYPDPTKPVYASITNALVEALSENGANGMPRWESYVLGLNPTDATAVLRLTAAPVSADGTQVAISTVIDKTKFPVLTNVTVTFRLAEQNGTEWTDVDGCTGSADPSFTRPLDGVVDKVLRIFADIEVR